MKYNEAEMIGGLACELFPGERGFDLKMSFRLAEFCCFTMDFFCSIDFVIKEDRDKKGIYWCGEYTYNNIDIKCYYMIDKDAKPDSMYPGSLCINFMSRDTIKSVYGEDIPDWMGSVLINLSIETDENDKEVFIFNLIDSDGAKNSPDRMIRCANVYKDGNIVVSNKKEGCTAVDWKFKSISMASLIIGGSIINELGMYDVVKIHNVLGNINSNYTSQNPCDGDDFEKGYVEKTLSYVFCKKYGLCDEISDKCEINYNDNEVGNISYRWNVPTFDCEVNEYMQNEEDLEEESDDDIEEDDEDKVIRFPEQDDEKGDE